VKRLSHYFPEADGQHRHRDDLVGCAADQSLAHKTGRVPNEDIPTKWRVILSLEMQGESKVDIAKHVGMTASAVSQITRDERYLAHREAYLETIDRDFLAMKPLAFKALQQGLTSSDEDTALKASDQWFRAAGFGGYSKRDEPATQTTAEDVVRQLLQINVQVNVGSDG
jgi:hypothetical protein